VGNHSRTYETERGSVQVRKDIAHPDEWRVWAGSGLLGIIRAYGAARFEWVSKKGVRSPKRFRQLKEAALDLAENAAGPD